jgi:hypothetical protein
MILNDIIYIISSSGGRFGFVILFTLIIICTTKTQRVKMKKSQNDAPTAIQVKDKKRFL